jgi:SAM-dependent methyltransferase
MTADKVENQYRDGTYLSRNPEWDRLDCTWKAELVRHVFDKFKLELKSVCEVGCGTGDILVNLKQYYPQYDYFGYDISPQAERFWNDHIHTGIHFHCGDFISIDTQYYDCILIIDVIEHIANPFHFLDAIKGRAKYFVFHFPLDLSAASVLREKPLLNSRFKVGHIHYFTKELALAILRDAGFNIMHYQYTNAYLKGPGRSLKTRIAALPRRLICTFGIDFGVRLLGGETLIVLAEVPRNVL